MSVPFDTISEIAKISLRLVDIPFFSLFRDKERLSAREEQLKLLHDLTAAQIDPALFDLMLSSELDRNLKKQFGVAFFIATIGVTAASYAVIILNATQQWGISTIAITALIVETPIQFIGLLYIIARNLFPQRQMRAELAPKPILRSAPRSAHQPRRGSDDTAQLPTRRVSRSKVQQSSES